MKKGFTLVEVLAIIIILGVIAVLTIPRIQNVLKTSKEAAYEMLVNNIQDKAHEYVKDNNLKSNITPSQPLNVFVHVLLSNRYIEEDQLVDPRDEKKSINKFASYVSFKLENGKIKSEAHFTSEEGTPSDDDKAPVIIVLGDNPVTLGTGSLYVDAGATAIDNKDGNITERIVTTGTVNPNVPGTYTIEYTVYDNAGNKGTSSRTIIYH